MKNSSIKIAFLLLLSVQFLTGQVTLSGGSWTNNGTSVDFIDLSSFGQNGVFALATSPQAIQSDPNTTYAGGGSAPTDFVPSGSSGNAYGFSLLPQAINDPANGTSDDFDIDSKNGSGGDVTFNFSGVSDFDFVAYTGGELKEYSYNSSASTLSITFSAITAAGSENNPGGGQKLLGMVIITGANTDFGGAVFRTDMYWGDVQMQLSDTSYGDTSDFPGSNFSGNDGDMVNFDYYINQSVLENLNQFPVTDIDQCSFRFTKADGTIVDPVINVEYYTADGNGTAWNNNESPDGTSTFDFNGDGTVDNYVNASVQNDSWSSANGYMNGDQSLGVESYQDALPFTIYPNPVENTLLISTALDEPLDIYVYNVIGKLVLSKFINNTRELNVTDLEPGVFILKIKSSSRVKFFKIIKK